MSTYSAEGVAGSHAGTGLGTRGEAVAVRLRPWARTDPASDVLHPGHSIRLRWLTPESENGAHVERVPARTCPQPHASGEHPHHAFDGHSGVFIIIPSLIVGLVLADLVLRSVEIGLFGSGFPRDCAAATSVAVGGTGEQTPSRGQSPSPRIRTPHREVRPGEW